MIRDEEKWRGDSSEGSVPESEPVSEQLFGDEEDDETMESADESLQNFVDVFHGLPGLIAEKLNGKKDPESWLKAFDVQLSRINKSMVSLSITQGGLNGESVDIYKDYERELAALTGKVIALKMEEFDLTNSIKTEMVRDLANLAGGLHQLFH